MKTLIYKFTIVAIFVFASCNAFCQKSVTYPSVGENVEEINVFLDQTFSNLNETSDEIINDIDTFLRQQLSNETIQKVTEWGEIQLNEINLAADEVKVWLSKQHFSTLKYSKKATAEVAESK